MKQIYFTLLTIASLLCGVCQAQGMQPDSAVHGVILHADSRLDMVVRKSEPRTAVHKSGPGRRAGMITSGRGFRVQIYSGSDRNVATQRKIDFLRRYPGVRTYMTYIAPTFRVKVGDYRDRKAAQAMYQQVSRLYNPCMIVNDIIEINSFHSND
jgi:hypothetical protein